ncbi:MAG: hypothetical protein NTW71_11565 [Deltaproteobacteria bacterium]|nr:hypothetical protein [Deltaproteobacteria bacterium]
MGLLNGLMGLFKPKTVKEIRDGTWGHLVHAHGLTVDTLSQNIRCVDKPGMKDGFQVNLLRIFSLSDVEKKGITITGWETFDQYPELIMFEGYLDGKNQAHLERKNGQKAG